MSTERAALYRNRVAESELKATQAKAEELRAWLIVARNGKRWVREEGKASMDALEQSRKYSITPALDEFIKLTR